MRLSDVKEFLDEKEAYYNRPSFVENDPVSIPHQFTKRQDIEISALFAAVLAWGQRITILNSCRELLRLMDHSPYEFVRHHKEGDLKRLARFKHRTFNAEDLLYFITFLQAYYLRHTTLEELFMVDSGDVTIEKGLVNFHHVFFSLPDFPGRTRKHIATPQRHSACKRMNMFLRWMVRNDGKGVDFGIWNKIPARQLVCPLDLHVDRVARRLKLITRKQADWKTALELTGVLRKFDPEDPVKYDFALFGLGIEEKF